MKTCALCQEAKPASGFYVRTDRGRSSLRSECKDCVKARTARRYQRRCETDREGIRQERREWQERNRDKLAEQSRRQRLRRYGLTEETFQSMLREQDGQCLICRNTFDEKRRPNVDHCHTTGVVRGILCWPCNSSLGKFEEDSTLLRAAADYLDHHRKRLA